MTSTKKEKEKEKVKPVEKEPQKCSHLGCYDDAIWTGTSDKGNGKWYYCDKHRGIIEPSCPHLKFEKL